MMFSYLKFWTHTALMFLLRSGRSTMALSIMLITAVAVLIFLSALAVGVNDAMLANSVGLFSGHISGQSLPAGLQPKDLMAEGVQNVLKRVYMPGVLSGGPLDLPLTLCGVMPNQEMAQTALHQKITSGRFPENGAHEVLMSQPISVELGLKIGSEVKFISPAMSGAMALKVVGIYQTHIEKLDRGIAFFPESILPEKNMPWSAAIFLKHGIDTEAVMRAYGHDLPRTCRFESWESQMPDLKQLIDLQYISMAMVIVLVFGVVSVGIACSFVIFIIKNMREYGIMKAMGVTSEEMTLFIVLKVAIMNIAACGVGFLIGIAVSWMVAAYGGIDISAFTSHNRYFAVSGVISPRLTVFSIWTPPVIAFLFSLAASVWPAALVARKKAADIIRMI